MHVNARKQEYKLARMYNLMSRLSTRGACVNGILKQLYTLLLLPSQGLTSYDSGEQRSICTRSNSLEHDRRIEHDAVNTCTTTAHSICILLAELLHLLMTWDMSTQTCSAQAVKMR